MKYTSEEIRLKIAEALPEGRVVTRHNNRGHFYEVIDGKFVAPPVYPSVTGFLQVIKDESLINYKMNCVSRYVFAHYKDFNDANIMEHIASAENVPQTNLTDAGDIGTEIHDHRQAIFEKWMQSGVRPADFVAEIPEAQRDIRAVSAIRALQSFVEDYDYRPLACELFVYSHKFKVAGTLDDLGIMRHYTRGGPGRAGWGECDHEIVITPNGKHTCMICDMQYVYEFTLMDIKSSNQLKDHYFYQVSLYWEMFRKLTGLQPERCIIVQLSKENGRYKIEDLKRPARLAQYSAHMLKVTEGTQFIKSLRRDNQKNVITL